jgi:hypothetical protein
MSSDVDFGGVDDSSVLVGIFFGELVLVSVVKVQEFAL